MARKPKFKPQVTRITLNPEQAVLTCNCIAGEFTYRFNNNGYYGNPPVYHAYCSGRNVYSGTACEAASQSNPNGWSQSAWQKASASANS